MRKEFLLLCLDLGAASASLPAALWLRFGGDPPPAHLLPVLLLLLPLAAWRVFAAGLFGLHDFRRRLAWSDHVFGAAGAAVLGAVPGYMALALLQLYYLPETELSRLAAVIDVLLLFLWFAGSRGALLRWLRLRGARVGVMAAGPAAAARELLEEIARHAPPLMKPIGFAADGPPEDGALGTVSEIEALIAEKRPGILVVAGGFEAQADLARTLAACAAHGTDVYLYPAIETAALSHARVISIADLPLAPMNPLEGAGVYRHGKRALDILLAGAGLILALPVALLAAAAIKLDSPGPALYRQIREGRGRRPFVIIKLRTMRHEAESGTGPAISAPGDPRVTRVGRVLRKIRLDEAPQLWNVLRGDMSLVGPRPERPAFAEQFRAENPLYDLRLSVRPGLTGLAQIHARYDTGHARKLRYDLLYLNGMSFGLDLRILLATIRTVLTGRGAM